MALDAVLSWLHALSVFGVGALLFAELLLLQPTLVRAAAQWLYKIDLAYFGAGIAAVVTGMLRAAYGIKGWSFYAQNPLFHAKISLFLTMGVVSIWPTIIFLRWGRALRRDQTYMIAPKDRRSVRRWVVSELLLFLLIPLLAAMMARGMKV